MKIIKLIISFIVLTGTSSKIYSQVELDTLTMNKIDKISIGDIDFDKFNSMNFEDIERHAWFAFMQKEYEKAAKYYLYILDNNMDDANALYNLSRCYAMLNSPELSGYFLIMSVNAGYNNFANIEKEESFKLLLGNEYFNNVMKQVSEYSNSFGKTIYTEAKVLVKSKVIFPKNFDPDKNYSLLVGLHGYGGVAENFIGIHDRIHSNDFIFIVPEAPYLKNSNGNKSLQYSWDFQVRDEELWKKSDPAIIDYIMNVVGQMNAKYKIDKNYVLGFSQGAAYAYCVGIKNPNKIDGVIAVGGRLPDFSKYPWLVSEKDILNGNKLKVFIVHGRNDQAVNYKRSVESKKRLKKYDYNVELFLFEGGHTIDEEGLNKALDWFGSMNK